MESKGTPQDQRGGSEDRFEKVGDFEQLAARQNKDEPSFTITDRYEMRTYLFLPLAG